MSEPVLRRWTVGEFFSWQERQEDRYELVDGFPVQMMTGTRNVHDTIVVNVVAELRDQLRGRICRPFTGGSSVETLPGQIRRPDAGVDCGQDDPKGLKALLPRRVVEVLSPSTQRIDLFVKLLEYQQTASLIYVVYVDPDDCSVAMWSRDEVGEWSQLRCTSLDDVLEMPAIGIRLSMSDIYERVILPPGSVA